MDAAFRIEWLFRVYSSPGECLKDTVGNFKFIQLVIKYKLSGKSYAPAVRIIIESILRQSTEVPV